MNNRGFTLVEILGVIVLLSIIIVITVPAIGVVSDNVKKSMLKTKIENIEKAAVLYAQEHRENFADSTCSYCSGISDCNCYSLAYTKTDINGNVLSSKNLTTIPVSKILNPSVALIDGEYTEANVNSTEKPYLEADDELGNIVNPTDESKYLNNCKIQIYQKYGKIYADYLNDTDSDIGTECWYQS